MRIREITEVYRDENRWLLNYLKKGYDHYDFVERFADWVFRDDRQEEVLQAFGLPDDASEEDLNEYVMDDPSRIANLPQDIQDAFQTYALEYIGPDDAGDPMSPSYLHLSLERTRPLPRTTWLIHFSDKAWNIASEGFKRGVDDVRYLGLTTYLNDREKENGGYNFALEVKDRVVGSVAREKKYGKNAVMFQSSGVKTYHSGDEERQIIFYGPAIDHRDIILLVSDGDDWYVQPHPTKESRKIPVETPKKVGWNSPATNPQINRREDRWAITDGHGALIMAGIANPERAQEIVAQIERNGGYINGPPNSRQEYIYKEARPIGPFQSTRESYGISKVISWVIQNHRQYASVITGR